MMWEETFIDFTAKDDRLGKEALEDNKLDSVVTKRLKAEAPALFHSYVQINMLDH